ncbi:MAG: hypothetical protein H7835_12700 [Magnetococcus sp. XQGC-1]
MFELRSLPGSDSMALFAQIGNLTVEFVRWRLMAARTLFLYGSIQKFMRELPTFPVFSHAHVVAMARDTILFE